MIFYICGKTPHLPQHIGITLALFALGFCLAEAFYYLKTSSEYFLVFIKFKFVSNIRLHF